MCPLSARLLQTPQYGEANKGSPPRLDTTTTKQPQQPTRRDFLRSCACSPVNDPALFAHRFVSSETQLQEIQPLFLPPYPLTSTCPGPISRMSIVDSNSTPTRLKLPTHPHRLQHQKNHGALFSAAPPLPSMDFSFSSPEEEQQQAPPPAAAVDDAVENCTKKAAGAKRKKAGGRGGGPVGRALRRVLSFMTILTTTYLFRFLLQGLNKVLTSGSFLGEEVSEIGSFSRRRAFPARLVQKIGLLLEKWKFCRERSFFFTS